MGNYPQGFSVCVCVHVLCVWVGVSANLQCMHIFVIDHLFICAKPEEQSVLSANLQPPVQTFKH